MSYFKYEEEVGHRFRGADRLRPDGRKGDIGEYAGRKVDVRELVKKKKNGKG